MKNTTNRKSLCCSRCTTSTAG